MFDVLSASELGACGNAYYYSHWPVYIALLLGVSSIFILCCLSLTKKQVLDKILRLVNAVNGFVK
jgi:hypothetical protein